MPTDRLHAPPDKDEQELLFVLRCSGLTPRQIIQRVALIPDPPRPIRPDHGLKVFNPDPEGGAAC